MNPSAGYCVSTGIEGRGFLLNRATAGPSTLNPGRAGTCQSRRHL